MDNDPKLKFGEGLQEAFNDIYFRPKTSREIRTEKYKELLPRLDPGDTHSHNILFSLFHHVTHTEEMPERFGFQSGLDFAMNGTRRIRPETMSTEQAQSIKDYLLERLEDENIGYVYDGFALDMPELWLDSTPEDRARGSYSNPDLDI